MRRKLSVDEKKNQGFLKEIKEKSQDDQAIKKITDRLIAIGKVKERCEFEN